MQFKKIHHVAIIASNYARSKKFYVETLGLEIIQETYRAERDSYKLDLRIGDGDQIEIFSFPNPPARITEPEACGLRHLALAVESLEETMATLQAKGVAVEEVRIDPVTHKKFTFFRDPDGLPLELYEQ